ncbi:uncharacterized protein LOC134205909 [Armigeres subalbatus]|uniref:uncharacterized protein LOC134205909 n=1 Tax=Armigeres subalbatus TaxID=124917 RepID=UPI002ED480FE
METSSKRIRGNTPTQWTEERRSRCARCFLYSHRNGQCPALNRNCNKCGKRGHFVAACRQKQLNTMQYDRRERSMDSTSSREHEYENAKQEVNALSLDDVLIDCSVGSSSPISFLIDSGADANIIGGKDWEQLERETRQGVATIEMIGRNSRNKFHAYGSQDPIVIECSFKAKINTIKPCSSELIKPAIFHVVLRGKDPPWTVYCKRHGTVTYQQQREQL